MPSPDTNLYLVGFMGTGKTTVGRAVAVRLGFQFLDSDLEIERKQGRTVAQIFADEGESAFRRMECEFVEQGHPPHRQVVACGGGLIMPPGMLEVLKTKGVIICLHASPETILRRTQHNRSRPLLDVADPLARIRALQAERDPIYRQAGSTILTDGRPLADLVPHVLRTYQQDARDFARRAQAHGP